MSYYAGDTAYNMQIKNNDNQENTTTQSEDYEEVVYESDDDASISSNSSNSDDCVSQSQLEEIEMYTSNRNNELKSRLNLLQNQMLSLQIKLETEKQLCKKELDEVNLLKNMKNIGNFTFQNDMDYADALIKAQNAKKNAIQRQLAINNYKKRLLEVENMCNLELLKVKQSVKFLHPLQVIVSEWQKETGKGDASKECSESETGTIPEEHKRKSIDIEAMGNMICSEMDSIFNKLNDEIKQASAVWQDDINSVEPSIADDTISINSTNAFLTINSSDNADFNQ